MSTPPSSVIGTSIIYANVDYGPTFGNVYRPVTQIRTVTAAGTDTIQPYDQYVRYKKTVPETFAVQLPNLVSWMSQPYGGFPLLLKDASINASTYPITVNAFAGQFIDGLAAYIIAADGATLYLKPLTDLSGWEIW